MRRISLSVRFRLFNQTLLALAFLVSASVVHAQSPDPNQSTPPPAEPTKSAEELQTRIGRARALIAAHRLETAASELESVRAATKDQSLRNITSVLLMSVYLEEGNYGRAEALLEENFQASAAQKHESLGTYFALAGQAVNGARTHLARYRSLGVSASDQSLPAEVTNDLNRLRSLLERMIAQAKDISNTKKAYDSLSLLEDVVGIRLAIAPDSEDEAKWQSEYVNARELLASSQTQIASLGGIPPLRPAQGPPKISPPSPYSTKKTGDRSDTGSAETSRQPETAESAQANSSAESITQAGQLNALATRRVVPQYPPMARQNGAAGLVRVHVIVDETGKVVTVSRSEGPMLLRAAAETAARQWSFQVNSTEGRPTRLSGYIDFNFTL